MGGWPHAALMQQDHMLPIWPNWPIWLNVLRSRSTRRCRILPCVVGMTARVRSGSYLSDEAGAEERVTGSVERFHVVRKVPRFYSTHQIVGVNCYQRPDLPLASARSDIIGWSRILLSHTLDAARSY